MATRTKLKRLSRVWVEPPIYFITTCVQKRRKILDNKIIANILIDEWRNTRERHGWMIGQYVIMPDHVHFFCHPEWTAKKLPHFIMRWKEWTSKRIQAETKSDTPIWQERFFDHVLRSPNSYSSKWQYVQNNPVRAGLVKNPNDWPWQGTIENLSM